MTQNPAETLRELEGRTRKKEQAMREASFQPFAQFYDWGKVGFHNRPARPRILTAEAARSTDGIELPFDPGEFDRDDVGVLLPEIDDYEEEVQTEIYRYARDFYTNEAANILPEDIINIRQTQLFADDAGHEEWIPELADVIESRFEEFQDSPLMSAKSKSSLEDTITPNKARELLKEREKNLREAMGEDFGTNKEEALEEMQISYVKLILPDIQDL